MTNITLSTELRCLKLEQQQQQQKIKRVFHSKQFVRIGKVRMSSGSQKGRLIVEFPGK